MFQQFGVVLGFQGWETHFSTQLGRV